MGGGATELEEKLPEAQTRKTPLPKRFPAVEKTRLLAGAPHSFASFGRSGRYVEPA